ncbi:unnamed protein product, partial [marine sediment metagenome]
SVILVKIDLNSNNRFLKIAFPIIGIAIPTNKKGSQNKLRKY